MRGRLGLAEHGLRILSDARAERPLPVNASVRTAGNLRLLHLAPPPDRAANAAWDNLVTDHGKLLHCFLISELDRPRFQRIFIPFEQTRDILDERPPPRQQGGTTGSTRS